MDKSQLMHVGNATSIGDFLGQRHALYILNPFVLMLAVGSVQLLDLGPSSCSGCVGMERVPSGGVHALGFLSSSCGICG